MDTWVQHAMPGEHHKLLGKMAGSWKTAVKYRMNADTPVVESEGTCKRKWILGDRFLLEVTLPANTTAVVRLPCNDPAKITESGRPLTANTEGVHGIRTEAGQVLVDAGSGTYRFACPAP